MSFQYVDTDLPPPDDWPEPGEPTPDDLAAPRRLDTRAFPARLHHLKAAGASGAHALHAFGQSDTDSLTHRLGNGTHALITGKPCVLWEQASDAWLKAKAKAEAAGKPVPPMSLAPRSGDKFKMFARAHAGATILIRSEMSAAKRMADAIMADGYASRLIKAPGVRFEEQLIGSMCGRSRRRTPDMFALDAPGWPSFVAEIKTTKCADPRVFHFDAKRYSYHAQLADQGDAIRQAYGKAPRHYYIIAVEKSPPHVVQVYELPADLIDKGMRLVTGWLERLQMFEATQAWGGYSPRVEVLEFPEYGAPPVTTTTPVLEHDDDDDDKA